MIALRIRPPRMAVFNSVSLAVSTCLLACAPSAAMEGSTETDGSAATTARVADAEPAMTGYLRERIEIAEDKFLQLAGAIPEEDYDWRPMEGVRSFREVFIHLAADNWAPMSMGLPLPEGLALSNDLESFVAYQEQRLDKEESVAELRRSFEFLKGSLDASRDRLDETVVFLGTEWVIGEMWVALVTHMHEHLGQTIAYARANGVVPPWSR